MEFPMEMTVIPKMRSLRPVIILMRYTTDINMWTIVSSQTIAPTVVRVRKNYMSSRLPIEEWPCRS